MGASTAVVLLLWTTSCLKQGAAQIVVSPLHWPLLAMVIFEMVQIGAGLSLDAIATREAAIKLLIYAFIFFLAQQLLVKCSGLRVVASAVMGFTFALSMFSILQFFLAPGVLYGLWHPRWGGYVFGPYVNHNHYAGLMEMLAPITLASAFDLPHHHARRAMAVFTALLAATSVLLSGSRGGAIALFVEAVLFVLVAYIRHGSRQARRFPILAGLAFASIVVAGSSWLDTGTIWRRWQDAADNPQLTMRMRAAITRDTLRMAREHLASGVGLGAFEIAYPRYQSMASDLVIDHAHNDYVQLWAEAGITGVIVAPIALGMFVYLAFRQLRVRLARPGGWIKAGAAVGVCGLLVHSLCDFNLHIPANAAWMATCAAIATTSPGTRSFEIA